MMTGRIINNLPKFRTRTDEGFMDWMSIRGNNIANMFNEKYIPDRWSMAWGTFAKELAKEVIEKRDRGIQGFFADHKDVLEGNVDEKKQPVNEEVVTEARGKKISDETYDKLIGHAKAALNLCLNRYGEYKEDAEEIDALIKNFIKNNGKQEFKENEELQKAIAGFNDMKSVIDRSFSQTKKEELTAEEREATAKNVKKKQKDDAPVENPPQKTEEPDPVGQEEPRKKDEEGEVPPAKETGNMPEKTDVPREELKNTEGDNVDGEDGTNNTDGTGSGTATIPPPPGPDGKPGNDPGTVIPGNDNIKPPAESTEKKQDGEISGKTDATEKKSEEEQNVQEQPKKCTGYSNVWDMIADFRRKYDKKGGITSRIINQMFAALGPVEKKMKKEGRDFAKDGAKEVARAALRASGGDIAAGAVR